MTKKPTESNIKLSGLTKIGPHYVDLENHSLSDYWAEGEDEEFWKWWNSLTPEEQDRLKGR